MTTNQTIDGVPRELLEDSWAALLQKGRVIRALQLRALLDREVITDDHLRQRIAFLTSEVHARANERDAALSGLAELKVAQPQGEPVAYLDLGKIQAGGMAYATKMRVNHRQTALYAETAGSDRPPHANPPPGTEPSGTHHDNDGLDEWRKP